MAVHCRRLVLRDGEERVVAGPRPQQLQGEQVVHAQRAFRAHDEQRLAPAAAQGGRRARLDEGREDDDGGAWRVGNRRGGGVSAVMGTVGWAWVDVRGWVRVRAEGRGLRGWD